MTYRWRARALVSVMASLVSTVCLVLVVSTAKAQTVVRLGSLFPATNFDSVANVKLPELIAQKTGGKLKVELFPASQLGSETEQTEQVRSGALQLPPS
jgi:TRAP-type C4-dicarboxylate transport system substrate-binding protein